jgi:hypothetical protein
MDVRIRPFSGVRCWSFFVDLAAFGLLVSRDRTKRLNPKRTAMTVLGNEPKSTYNWIEMLGANVVLWNAMH